MTTTTQDPTPKTARKAFDEARRAKALALINLGCSRRLAAEEVGCHHTTIARAARRDPQFAAQLEEAESRVDFAALTRINEAAAENKNWRAAAWILERRHPEEFGRRAPHSFSGDQVMALLAEVFDYSQPLLPKDKIDDFLRRFNFTLRGVEANAQRPDRWRKQGGARADGTKALRSPYEHPQWADPDRLLSPQEEDTEFQAWLRSLSDEEFERLNRAVRRQLPDGALGIFSWKLRKDRKAIEQFKSLLAAEEIAQQQHVEEPAVEEQRAEKGTCAEFCVNASYSTGKGDSPIFADTKIGTVPEKVESAESPVVVEEQPQTAAIETAGPTTASSPVPPCPAEQPAAMTVEPVQPPATEEKRTQAAALQSAAERPTPMKQEAVQPSATEEKRTQAAAVQSAAPTSSPVRRAGPPTGLEHQSYREWLAERNAMLLHNLLLMQGLQLGIPDAPPGANLAGGASQGRLQAWTEAMRH